MAPAQVDQTDIQVNDTKKPWIGAASRDSSQRQRGRDLMHRGYRGTIALTL